MVNFLETLYVVTALAVLVGIVAWVQSKGGGDRGPRYRQRMRRAFSVALVTGIVSAALYLYVTR